MEPAILGLHHVTAIASDPQRNLDFYTQLLGLRLVKLTVNFDDPGTYHFYFGDGAGSPGTTAGCSAAVGAATDLAIDRYAGSISYEPRDASYERSYNILSGAGVPYDDSHLGSEYVYARKWFYDAYAPDSSGPIGRMLLIPLLAQGWGANSTCMKTGGSLGARGVITHGEAALGRGAPDPLIHFLVGEAYMDDVALAQGALEGYAEAKDFTAAAKVSRPKAIAHFLAALPGLRDKELQRKAWIYAMRLMVGARTTTTFTCVYD